MFAGLPLSSISPKGLGSDGELFTAMESHSLLELAQVVLRPAEGAQVVLRSQSSNPSRTSRLSGTHLEHLVSISHISCPRRQLGHLDSMRGAENEMLK